MIIFFWPWSFVEADLLQKQINRDFTRNNQPLLDVVVDELSVLASATTERLEKSYSPSPRGDSLQR